MGSPETPHMRVHTRMECAHITRKRGWEPRPRGRVTRWELGLCRLPRGCSCPRGLRPEEKSPGPSLKWLFKPTCAGSSLRACGDVAPHVAVFTRSVALGFASVIRAGTSALQAEAWGRGCSGSVPPEASAKSAASQGADLRAAGGASRQLLALPGAAGERQFRPPAPGPLAPRCCEHVGWSCWNVRGRGCRALGTGHGAPCQRGFRPTANGAVACSALWG